MNGDDTYPCILGRSTFGLVFRKSKDQPKREVVFAERFAETKLRTERSLNPKLINSPVDFACVIKGKDKGQTVRTTEASHYFLYEAKFMSTCC